MRARMHGIGRPRQACFAFLMLLIGGGAVQAESFFSNPFYDLPADCFSLLSADLNQDGRPDLVAGSGGQIFVALALPEGKFGPPVRWSTTSGSPISLAVGDFNGDSIPDLAQPEFTSNSGSPGVTILFGKGGGVFREAIQVPIEGAFQNDYIATGDLNGDGIDDLAVGSNGGIWVLLSHGDGSFASSSLVASGVFGANLAIADLNGDGKRDLIALDILVPPPAQPSQPGFVRVFLGQGDGTFTAPVSTGVGIFPIALAVADLNHDGKPDLAVANRNSSTVSVLLGQGDGTFASQSPILILGFLGAVSVLAQDLDGDGHADLAVSTGDVFFCRGKGDGTFEAPIMSRSWGQATDLAVGDFDGDSRPDLAALNSPFTIALLFSNGNGTFGGNVNRVHFADSGGGLNTGDFNRDGIPDLAVLVDHTDIQTGIYVRLGLGNGGFDPTPRVSPLANSFLLPPNAVGDFDGDGDPDLVLMFGGSTGVTIMLGNGDGTFSVKGSFTAPGGASSVAIVDADNDGIQDLALGMASPNSLTVLKGAGDGSFTFLSALPLDAAPFFSGIAAGDFNADHAADVVIVHALPFLPPQPFPPPPLRDVYVLFGHGDGTFQQPLLLPAAADPRWPLVADFNGDGISDLAVPDANTFFGQPFSQGVGVHISRGDGTFEPPVWSFFNPAPAFLTAADFDGDGKLDMAVGKSGRDLEISILIGRGDGTFRPPLGFGGTLLPGFMVTADFNRDGKTDLALSDSSGIDGYNAALLLNRLGGPRHGPDAGAESVPAECGGAELNGSTSTDPDSSPGTHDDILGFDWFEVVDPFSARFLGRGEVLSADLPSGDHAIRLVVTDRIGEADSEDFFVSTAPADTTPPDLAVVLSRTILSPANHKLSPVHATVSAEDRCGAVTVVLESITSSEPDDTPGGSDGNTTGDIGDADFGTADFDFLLRAERLVPGPGRLYIVKYRATDAAGNSALATATVRVPGTPTNPGPTLPRAPEVNGGAPAGAKRILQR